MLRCWGTDIRIEVHQLVYEVVQVPRWDGANMGVNHSGFGQQPKGSCSVELESCYWI